MRVDRRRATRPRSGSTGHQFYWQYTYPNGAISFDTLYLPVGKTASLELHSKDVNHSWWVPELTGKLDAIPGHPNTLDFEPRRTGHLRERQVRRVLRYPTRDHGHDRPRRVGRPSTGPGSRTTPPATPRRPSLRSASRNGLPRCAKCHGLDGSGDIGPSIQGNGTLLNRSGLEAAAPERPERSRPSTATCRPWVQAGRSGSSMLSSPT